MIVCITGVHRSGTSVLARIVNLIGVDMGPQKRLMGALPENPGGFWENMSIVAFNDRLLTTLGGTWDDPPRLSPGWERSVKLNRERANAGVLIRNELGVVGARGWKDPRACLLLPFWRVVAPGTKTLVSLRHPKEVAGSLAKRDGFDEEKSALIWLRYAASVGLADPTALVVTYDSLYENPVAVARDLARYLGLAPPWPEVQTSIRDWLDPSLRHHVGWEDDAASDVMRVAAGVYQVLSANPLAEVQPLLRAVDDISLAAGQDINPNEGRVE